ncbi:GAF and ANTAR domain-containing protein [Kineococcus arenarius]|uniref:GAF and ANTAR domain-containing protein n=1 Tax=Kineococcus sp. SYSU DK007 TaxID=3383128 RepID=UPI003D7EA7E1
MGAAAEHRRNGREDAAGAAPLDLVNALADMARELQRQEDPQAVMERIVLAAVALVPGAEDATITRVNGRRHVFSQAASSKRAQRLDELQEQTGQGPCLDTLYTQQTTRVRDLATETRWPLLAEHTAHANVRSMLCFQLFVAGDNLGALNLISARPDAFDDEAEEIGLPFATHAAIALADAEQLVHVRTAMAGRDVIGQAKGILMERYKITADQAFALLTRVSQDSNRKLREIAEELAATGRLGR